MREADPILHGWQMGHISRDESTGARLGGSGRKQSAGRIIRFVQQPPWFGPPPGAPSSLGRRTRLRPDHGEDCVKEDDNMTASLPPWIPQRLLTVEEVANLLHVSTRQVRRMITENRLQVLRLGRAVRIPPEALAAMLEGT